MTQFIKIYDTIFSNFKYKNDTIYKKCMSQKIYYNYI